MAFKGRGLWKTQKRLSLTKMIYKKVNYNRSRSFQYISTYTAFLHIASTVTDLQPASHKRGKRIIGVLIGVAIGCAIFCGSGIYNRAKHKHALNLVRIPEGAMYTLPCN